MNLLPDYLFEINQIDTINILGKGGKEQNISALIPKWNRSNSALYDYEIRHEGSLLKIEVKKQENKQWFDSGKYHLLSETDRDIIMLFIIHKKGQINKIVAIKLGCFIDLLLSDPLCQSQG